MKRVTDKQYFMDQYLIDKLNSIHYNLRKDWDFVFIVSGDGEVRVGKSVIAQQIGYFIAQKMGTPFGLDNIVFSGEEMMECAHRFPKRSVLVYDEARGEMDSKKTMERVSKILMDFFAETGMYNHFIILVLPDFFEMSKFIAVNRSQALINVYKKEKSIKFKGNQVVKFERGFFEFFGKGRKKQLYMKGKKEYHNYRAVKFNMHGSFPNFHVIDKELYESKKLDYLKRDRTKKENMEFYKLKILLYRLKNNDEFDFSTVKFAKMLNVTPRTVRRYAQDGQKLLEREENHQNSKEGRTDIGQLISINPTGSGVHG